MTNPSASSQSGASDLPPELQEIYKKLNSFLPATDEKLKHSAELRHIVQGLKKFQKVASGATFAELAQKMNDFKFRKGKKGWSEPTLNRVLNGKFWADEMHLRLIDLTIYFLYIYRWQELEVDPDTFAFMMGKQILLEGFADLEKIKSSTTDSLSFAEEEAMLFELEEHTVAKKNAGARTKSSIYYRIYYPRHVDFDTRNIDPDEIDRIGVGLVTVPDSDWKRAQLQLIYSKHVLEMSLTAVSKSHGLLFLQFKDKGEVVLSEKDGQLLLGNELSTGRATAYNQIVLNYAYPDQNILIGTYSTAHRQPAEATAGLMVWQKIDASEAVMESIRTFLTRDNVPVSIRYFLFNQRLDTDHQRFVDQNKLPFAAQVKQFEPYARKYQGYYLHPVKAGTIVLFDCFIHKDGLVRCKFDSLTHHISILNGFTRFLDKGIRLNLDQQKDRQTFRMHYNLPKLYERQDGTDYWIGNFAGYHDQEHIPVSGLVVLQPQDSPIVQDLPMEQFRQLANTSYIETLLTGGKTLVSGSVITSSIPENEKGCHQSGGDNRNNVNDLNLQDDFFPEDSFAFKGIYTCFLVNRGPLQSSMVAYRVIIETNAVVKLDRDCTQCIGTASYQSDQYLSIQIDAESDSQFIGTFLFSLYQLETTSPVHGYRDVQKLYGILVRLKKKDWVEACAVVLLPEDPEDSTRQWLGEINRKGALFAELDQRYKGALSFLSGWLNRHIRVPRTVNRPFRPRQEDYRRAAFFGACYLAQKEFENRVDKERKGGNMTDLIKDTPKHVIDTIRSYFRECSTIGFAANQFAGLIVSEEFRNRRSLKRAFANHGIPEEHNWEQLEVSISSLLDDQLLIIDVITKHQSTWHPKVIEQLTELWPYLFSAELIKPETPNA